MASNDWLRRPHGPDAVCRCNLNAVSLALLNKRRTALIIGG
jgi:hypothetical protein